METENKKGWRYKKTGLWDAEYNHVVRRDGLDRTDLRSRLPSMHWDVLAQVDAWYERLATVRTAELFAVCVDGHVNLQGTGLGEALAAVHAAVAFLSGVDALVAFQVAGVGEAFATERADKRFLARVDPHVGLQVLQAGQRFATAVTNKGAPATVLSAVVPGCVYSILTPPSIPSDESVASSCRLRPRRIPRLVGSQRRPLLAVCEHCRLLVLRHRRTHLRDGEREAGAARICGNVRAAAEHVGAAGILAPRILGDARAVLQLWLVQHTAGVEGLLERHGGGADFAAHPGLRWAVVFIRRFLFGPQVWSIRLCHLLVINTIKTSWREQKTT